MSESLRVTRRSDQSLEKAYKHLEKSPVSATSEAPLPEDVVAHEAKRDPWAWGVWASIRFTGFLKMLNKQNAAVTVHQLMFALELTALNWFNAEGLPLTPDELKRTKAAAREYYLRGIREGAKP